VVPGIFWIIKKNIAKNGTVTFERVYPKKGDPGNGGIGGYALSDSRRPSLRL
jgi:hypothetical protein